MEILKETNPKLTSKKKREAKEYIKYIEEQTGIKFKCKSIKDYIFLLILYLLLKEYEDVDKKFYIPIANYYYEENPKEIIEQPYYGYYLSDILKQYIVKYYYQDLTNFAVIWEYYNWLVEDEWEDRLNIAFNTLEHKIIKNEEKIIRLLDNIGIKMADDSVLLKAIDSGRKFRIKWVSQKDDRVCIDCKERNGDLYETIDDIPEKHPNCRCYFEIVYIN